jgi:RimJ/RimL family protein N-acetyltransferase/ADP-ribose pyrophosphatase YjhB (NUDIX family)
MDRAFSGLGAAESRIHRVVVADLGRMWGVTDGEHGPDDAVPERTWDGLPVARDEPHGAQVVVRRAARPGGAQFEYLILHRARRGARYEGDWAWTPPSGARLPGESVLSGALRELGEETGIRAADLQPVDLSGSWAVFIADVPPDTPVRVDAEHDRFEWLPATEAARRCLPESVAGTFMKAAALPALRITFRPLARGDLPDLIAWMHAPHAVRWFYQDLDLPAAERKYGPRIDGTSPIRVHVVLVDGRPCGFLQHYRLPGDPGGRDTRRGSDQPPATAPPPGEPDAAGIDYLIGARELTGKGVGPGMIWSYLRWVVLVASPEARQVVASPEVANRRSIRALEKAGFARVRQVAGEDPGRPEMLCVLDRRRVFG